MSSHLLPRTELRIAVRRALHRSRAVVLNGPRQSRKTRLGCALISVAMRHCIAQAIDVVLATGDTSITSACHKNAAAATIRQTSTPNALPASAPNAAPIGREP